MVNWYFISFLQAMAELILLCSINICTLLVILKAVYNKKVRILRHCVIGLFVVTMIWVARYVFVTLAILADTQSQSTSYLSVFLVHLKSAVMYIPFIILMISRRVNKLQLAAPICVALISIKSCLSIISRGQAEARPWAFLVLALAVALIIVAIIGSKKILFNWHFGENEMTRYSNVGISILLGILTGISIASWIAVMLDIANLVVLAISAITSVVYSVIFYLIPTIVAVKRKHLQKVPIILVNILLGWSLIGWVVSLVWAFANKSPKIVHIHQQSPNDFTFKIQELEKLRREGLLSTEEFENKKKEILKSV